MQPWQRKQLGDLCEVFADGDWVESKDQSYEGIRLIQTGNVGEGIFKDRAEKARYISEATFKRLRCTEIFEGDCLIPNPTDQDRCAQSRRPIDMMVQGWSTSLFQAKQQCSRISP